MNAISNLGLLAILLLPSTAAGQDRLATLAQAQETFSVADTNKDGKLSPEELAALKLQLTRSDTRGVDFDRDGYWSKDEFLLFYRQRLLAANVKPAADLEAEATRILAARKAKTAERGPRPASADGGVLSEALDQLQAKASAGQASGSDFDRVRDLLVADARAQDQLAKGQDPLAGEHSDLQGKLLQTIERLRAAAAAGSFSREEYQDLRATIVKRARNTANGTAPATTPSTDPGEEVRAIGQALAEALDRLEQRAVAGNATREDFERVRTQLIARARAAAAGTSTPGAVEPELQSPLHTQMIQTLERLQAAAASGSFSREEYLAFRESLVRRFRNAQGATAGVSPTSAPAAGNSDPHSIEQGLSDALDHLEQRAAAGGATREDFQGVRDQLIARARAAARSAGAAAPAGADAQASVQRELMQALDRLEAAARQGSFSREEYTQLRASMIHRARESERAAPAPTAVAGTASDEAGMNQAADELEKRVNGGQVAPADFAKLRGLIADKLQAASARTDPASVNEASLYQKLVQSLDRLEKAAQNGSVDRQEFQAFRDSFVHRARQIASSSQQANSASGTTSAEQGSSGKRAVTPVATPAGTQSPPIEKAGAQRADGKADKGEKGEKNESKPAPQSRPKPGAGDPEKPQPPPPQQPPHRAG